MKKAIYDAQFKAMPDAGPGAFEAYVSVYGNVDLQGDRVMPKAFDESIREWRRSGKTFPIVFAHQWNDPWAHIGSADPKNIQSDSHGLKIAGSLDIDTNPFAAQVYRLMKRGQLDNMSFAWEPAEGGYSQSKEDHAWEISKAQLIEAGPCLKGANPEAGLVTLKSDEARQVLEMARLALASADQKTEQASEDGQESAPSAATKVRIDFDALAEKVSALVASEMKGFLAKSEDAANAETDETSKSDEPAGAKDEDSIDALKARLATMKVAQEQT